VPEESAPSDFGNSVLRLLEGLLLPDWGDLINLMPVLLILGLLGPALTLLALYWMYSRARTRRGRVRTGDPEPVAARIGPDGNRVYPPNMPFCQRHELLYPPTARTCEIDGEELLVRCPIDDMTRVASEQTCRVCGTRYQLGASLAPIIVRRHGRPPDGGAAVA
jgi:hypothetical protein